MIDENGYRANVCATIVNAKGQLFWAKRFHQDGWQFPQGGVDPGETGLEAMYRELFEEVGLRPDDVKLLAVTPGWLKYNLPEKYIRKRRRCIGQRQKWFLFQLLAPGEKICFDATGHKPEFRDWRWVNYWLPTEKIIFFKKDAYQEALAYFLPFVEKIAV